MGEIAVVGRRHFLPRGYNYQTASQAPPFVQQRYICRPVVLPWARKELVQLGIVRRLGGFEDDECQHRNAGHVENHRVCGPVGRARDAAPAAAQHCRLGTGRLRGRWPLREGRAVGPRLSGRLPAAARRHRVHGWVRGPPAMLRHYRRRHEIRRSSPPPPIWNVGFTEEPRGGWTTCQTQYLIVLTQRAPFPSVFSIY